MSYFVYILRCSDDSFYTGYTTDIKKRLAEHHGESTRPGARYTRSRRPVKVVYLEVCESRREAMSREANIKQLDRKEKERLIITHGSQESH